MKITDKWSIEKEKSGFSLVEKTVVEKTIKSKKTGETTEGTKTYSYGTVYQALQALLEKATTEEMSLYNIGLEIESLLFTIMNAKEEIKKEFRTEVKVVR